MATASGKPTCTVVAGPNGAGKTTFASGSAPALIFEQDRLGRRVADRGRYDELMGCAQ